MTQRFVKHPFYQPCGKKPFGRAPCEAACQLSRSFCSGFPQMGPAAVDTAASDASWENVPTRAANLDPNVKKRFRTCVYKVRELHLPQAQVQTLQKCNRGYTYSSCNAHWWQLSADGELTTTTKILSHQLTVRRLNMSVCGMAFE